MQNHRGHALLSVALASSCVVVPANDHRIPDEADHADPKQLPPREVFESAQQIEVLSPSNDVAAEWRSAIIETMAAHAHDSRYLLVFGAAPAPEGAVLSRPDGLWLHSIERTEAEDPTCTSMLQLDPVNQGDPLDLINLESGICGHMAVVQSLVKLGVWSPQDTFDGGYIKPSRLDEIRRFQIEDPEGMKTPEIAAAHQALGTGPCEIVDLVDCGDDEAIARLLQELADHVNDDDPEWDCTLRVAHEDEASAHVEHVNGVGVRNGHTYIFTKNGYFQGNQTTTVPAEPLINVWEHDPRGICGMFHQEPYAKGEPANRAVTHFGHVCCPKRSD